MVVIHDRAVRARWHTDHLAWAKDVRHWQKVVGAALFDVELALWEARYLSAGCSPPTRLERLFLTLRTLNHALEQHLEEIRGHEADMVDPAPVPARLERVRTPERALSARHADQASQHERLAACVHIVLSQLRSALHQAAEGFDP